LAKGTKSLFLYCVIYDSMVLLSEISIKISICRFTVPADLQLDLNICTTPLLFSHPITRSVNDVFSPNYFISANRLTDTSDCALKKEGSKSTKHASIGPQKKILGINTTHLKSQWERFALYT